MIPKIGEKFRAITTDQEFELEMITDKINGKKIKEPVYLFRYTNRNNQKFTCYLKDIERSIDFGSWAKID